MPSETSHPLILNVEELWKSEPRITPEFRRLENTLRALPLIPPSSVRYMETQEGYYFDLYLKGDIRITLSQYIDEFEGGGYVNVWLEGEIVFQGRMTLNELVDSLNSYYSGENE